MKHICCLLDLTFLFQHLTAHPTWWELFFSAPGGITNIIKNGRDYLHQPWQSWNAEQMFLANPCTWAPVVNIHQHFSFISEFLSFFFAFKTGFHPWVLQCPRWKFSRNNSCLIVLSLIKCSMKEARRTWGIMKYKQCKLYSFSWSMESRVNSDLQLKVFFRCFAEGFCEVQRGY